MARCAVHATCSGAILPAHKAGWRCQPINRRTDLMNLSLAAACSLFISLTNLVASVSAAESPIPAGTKPKNEGELGAGEGPAWHPSGHLYFSGGNRITRFDGKGQKHIFRDPSGGANGLLFDSEKRLVVCESGRRRVTRTEADGSIVVMADNFEGKRFNTPNDLTIDSKGRIYFTDPRYGKREDMEIRDEQGRLIEGVYRIDAPGRVARLIGREMERPNGILVSPDDKYLFVADNNNNNVGGARKLLRFELKADGAIEPASRKVIFDWETGRGPDGLKMDRNGVLYVAGGLNIASPPFETADKFKGGVYVLSTEGKLLDFIAIPKDEVTNCAFGGEDLKTLFITAGGTLWSIRVNTQGRVSYER
jgi:gluconolactonase